MSGKGNGEPFQLSKGLLQTAGREKGFHTLGKTPRWCSSLKQTLHRRPWVALFSTSLIPNIRKNPLSQGAHGSTVLAAAQVSVQSAVQTTAEPPSYFSGLNNFAVHHPEPTAKPRTSPHSSLQRVRDISYTSCFLSRSAMGNLQVTDEEADMLHPSHSVRKRHDHAGK